jgi:hypothetical protein
MSQTVSIQITGTEATVKSTGRKYMRMVLRNAEVAGRNTVHRSANDSANDLQADAISRVRKSGRSGGIHENILKRRLGAGRYQVYVRTPSRWGSRKSDTARKIYPLAQELSFTPHRVYVTMMPADSKLRQKLENQGIRFVTVSGFTPYMVPAYLRIIHKSGDILKKALQKETRAMLKRIKNKEGWNRKQIIYAMQEPSHNPYDVKSYM